MLNDDEDISTLWQRHLITAVRDNLSLSAASVQAIPSVLDGDEGMFTKHGEEIPVGAVWDEQIDSVVDALQELTIQSPTTIRTTETHSPEAPWFADREAYSETALSSPQNSSWSRTIAPSKAKQPNRLSAHDEAIEILIGNEINPSEDKGKGYTTSLTRNSPERTRHPSLPDWYTEKHLAAADTDTFETESYYRSYYNYNPNARNIPPDPPTVTLRYAPNRASQIERLPEQVHVLILTWAKASARRSDDGQLLSPALDIETDAIRTCFKRRGYRVQCRHVPEDYPTAAVETILDKFLDRSNDKSLLVVYYHGYGNMEGGRMVFSSDPAISTSPPSSFFWDDIRDPIMQSPGDVLLIFDCRPLPLPFTENLNAAAREDAATTTLLPVIDAGLTSSPLPSTKQLLAISTPSSSAPKTTSTSTSTTSTSNRAGTDSLCRVLDGERQAVSVQRLCSSIREELKATGGGGAGTIDSTSTTTGVFVTQLGGGQLGDIRLPWFG